MHRVTLSSHRTTAEFAKMAVSVVSDRLVLGNHTPLPGFLALCLLWEPGAQVLTQPRALDSPPFVGVRHLLRVPHWPNQAHNGLTSPFRAGGFNRFSRPGREGSDLVCRMRISMQLNSRSCARWVMKCALFTVYPGCLVMALLLQLCNASWSLKQHLVNGLTVGG